MLRNNADARRCSYFELGLPVSILMAICAAHQGGLFASPDSGTGYENYKRGIFSTSV